MFDVNNKNLPSEIQSANNISRTNSNNECTNQKYIHRLNTNNSDCICLQNTQSSNNSPAKSQCGFFEMTWDIFKNIIGIGKRTTNTSAFSVKEPEVITAQTPLKIAEEQSIQSEKQNMTDISKLSISEKRNLLKKLSAENNENNNKDSIDKIVKSIGIDTRPLTEEIKNGFYEALSSIDSKDSKFRTFDFENPDFKIGLEYSRENFIKDIDEITSHLSEQDKNTVCGYFGFELTNVYSHKVINGYPSILNNGDELEKIQNPELKETIEKMQPLVKDFSENNKIKIDEEHEVSKEMNKIIKAFPEFLTEIGKKQHGTHSFTLDIHSLKVLQGVINNPDYEKLPQNDKTALKIVALFHDITKREWINDKLHPLESALDIKYLLQKLDIDESEKEKIYKIAKNHNWLELYNKRGSEIIPEIADELKNGNDFKMACILTEADLKAVQRNGMFYKCFKNDLERGKDEVGEAVDKLQKLNK